MKINRQFPRVVAAATATLSLLLINSAPSFANYYSPGWLTTPVDTLADEIMFLEDH